MPTTDEEVLRGILHASTGDLELAPGSARAILTRQRRRRRAARGLLAGVPAAGLAAGGLAVAAHTGTAPATSAHRPSIETVASVTRQVEAALGNADGYIIQTTDTQPGGATFTTDTDPATFNSRQTVTVGSDRSVTWSQFKDVANTLHVRNTVADYQSHTWFAVNLQATGPMAGGEPKKGTDAFGGLPAWIEQDIKEGRLSIVGRGQVNGHNAVGLRPAREHGVFTEIWVDARTCQPLRLIMAGAGARKVTNITWIPKTRALSRAVNTPSIPAGFAHVSPPLPGTP